MNAVCALTCAIFWLITSLVPESTHFFLHNEPRFAVPYDQQIEL
jgi:hypothetical protein